MSFNIQAPLQPHNMNTQYTIKVSKADNGWLVTCNTVAFVVQGDEDLGQTIAAAIVTSRLTDDDTHAKTMKAEYERMQAQSRQALNSAWNQGMAGASSNAAMGSLFGQHLCRPENEVNLTSTALIPPPDESFIKQVIKYIKDKP